MAPPRVVSLDGLRGLAALLVVIHHALLTMSGFSAVYWGLPEPWFVTPFAHTPLHVVWAGGEAVLVFFVLSGVVLTLPAANGRAARWRAYYPSRLLRLYVPVVAAVLFAVVCALVWPRFVGAEYSEWVRAHGEQISPATVVRDMVLLNGTSWLNSPLWSLRWEVVFSLLLPVYVWVAVRFGRRWWPVIAAGLCAVSAIGSAVGSDEMRYLPYFGLGALIAVNMPEIANSAQRFFAGRRGQIAEVVLGAVAALLITFSWWGPTSAGSVGTALRAIPVVVGVVLVVVLAIGSPGARRLLSTRALTGLGTISFSLYLTHEPIVVSLAVMVPPDRSWVAPLLALPICLVIAWCFWKGVERPAHRLARSVARMADPRRQSADRDGRRMRESSPRGHEGRVDRIDGRPGDGPRPGYAVTMPCPHDQLSREDAGPWICRQCGQVFGAASSAPAPNP
ncbi:acyltransferase family protein [Microbacterium hibisci]|uniref:acyltransferase family protein n=1 Tax=Microbacterium hibisci TaxID=2036000 RepID=UPI00194325AC|nr:acyltransferase [Microbacterium hibisci]